MSSSVAEAVTKERLHSSGEDYLKAIFILEAQHGSVRSVEVAEYMNGFHISKKFSVPVSVMFRFFPTIREEYQLIRDTLRLRGIGTLAHPSEMLEYRMVPLLTELVQVGNELSASAMTRGLDAPNKRTNVCRSGFHTQDTIAFVFCAVVIMLFIISKVLGL